MPLMVVVMVLPGLRGWRRLARGAAAAAWFVSVSELVGRTWVVLVRPAAM